MKRRGPVLRPIEYARACAHRAAQCFASGARGLGEEIKETPRLEFIPHQPLRYLAVTRFRQRVPEEETLRHLVARHLRSEKCCQLGFAHRACALARYADGDADLAPERVGHAEHRHLADPWMREDLLLDLARIDVGSAGD